jgi:hypothetical protein
MPKNDEKEPETSRPRKKRKRTALPEPGKTLIAGGAVPTNAEMVVREATDEQLGDDQVLQILVDCVPRAGGSSDEIQMTKALKDYRFLSKDQVLVLNSFVTGSKDFGVQRYSFKLSDDALAFAVPATVMNDYATAIQTKAKKST